MLWRLRLMWVSVLSEDATEKEQLIRPIKDYLETTDSRVPFSDWYDTKTGLSVNFKNRSVVGAMFMPLLKEKLKS